MPERAPTVEPEADVAARAGGRAPVIGDTAVPATATGWLELQRAVGNQAVAGVVARGGRGVQRDPDGAPAAPAAPPAPPKGDSDTASPNDWYRIEAIGEDPRQIVARTVDLFASVATVRPDPTFARKLNVLTQPGAAVIHFEDYVVGIDRSAQPVKVMKQTDPPVMTADSLVLIHESGTTNIWILGTNERGQIRAIPYFNVGAQPIEGLAEGQSRFLIYVPGMPLGDDVAASMRRRAKGAPGTGAEAPDWAHTAVDRLRKRYGGAGAPGGTEEGRGLGVEDKGGTGGGGTGVDPAAVPGGDGRPAVDGATPGGGEGKGKGKGEEKAPGATSTPPGTGAPPGPRPLQGPPSFKLQTSASGTPQVRVTVDRATTTVDLKGGERDDALDQRVATAIEDLQQSRDPNASTTVQGGAKQTAFTPPPKGARGQVVPPDQANQQAASSPTGAVPSQRIPGARGGANAPEYPSHLTFSGEKPEHAVVTTSGATNAFGMVLEYAARSMGLQDEVWNRLQTIEFYWELIDVTGVAAEQQEATAMATKAGGGERVDPASGEIRNIGRTMEDIAEDQEADLQMMRDENWSWEARAAYLGVIGLSNVVRTLGSIISSFVALVTQPLNERSIGFDQEGEFVIRCVATPQVNDAARADPEHHVIRASSVAVLPIKVMNVNARATAAVDEEARKLAALEAAVRDAKDDKARQAAVAKLEAFRKGRRESGFERYQSTLAGARAELATARAVKKHVDAREPEETWTLQELYLQIALLRDKETVDARIRRLERQLVAIGGEDADKEGKTGEHEKWVAAQHGEFKGDEYRPRVVLASEVNGQVTPVQFMLGEKRTPSSSDERPRWRLVDITSPGSRDIYEGEGQGTGTAGHQAAIRDAFRNFAEGNQYGRGTIAIRLPAELLSKYGEIVIDAQMHSRPGAKDRALQRLKDLATVAEIAGLFATGGVGVALGAVGGLAGATVAIESLSRRARTGHTLEVGTIFDVLGVIGGAASVVGVGTAVGRARLDELAAGGHAAPAWVSKLERTERGLHIHGVFGNVQAVMQIPYQLITELNAIEAAGGEEGERNARRALALLNAMKSGAVTFVQATGGIRVGDEPTTRPAAGGELPPGTGSGEAQSHADGSGPARPPVTGEGATAPVEGTGGTRPPVAGEGEAAPGARTPSEAEIVARARELAEIRLRQAEAAVGEAAGVTPAPAGEGEGAGATGRPPASERPGTTATPPAAEPVSAAAGRRDALAAVAERAGAAPTGDAGRVRDDATARPAGADPDALRLLREAGSFGTVRRDVEAMAGSLTGPQLTAVTSRLQEARLAVTNGRVAAVLADMRARFPDLNFVVQDLGTVGFHSDRDITIRVVAGDEAAYARLGDAERGAMDRRMIQASAEAVPELYRALEAAGFPANAALDTNFYTELHEGRVRPADAGEAQRITADQQIVSLAEIIVNAGPEAWRDYVAHQRAEIDTLAAKGTTPEADIAALRTRLDQQVAAAEAGVRRLLGDLPAPGASATRDAALTATRQRLVEAVKQEPPPSAQELRQLMADIKLLEPDAYGTRAAVEGVVLGGQAMTAATLDAVRAAGFRTRRQIERGEGEPGPRRFDEATGRMDEVAAEDEVARRRAEAHAHVGPRRPGDADQSAYEKDAPRLAAAEAVIGHLLGHLPAAGEASAADVRAAAKNLGRIVATSDEVGVRSADTGLAHLPDIVAAKGAPDAAVATAQALAGWAREPSVRSWAADSGVALGNDVERLGAFTSWARSQALGLTARLRVRVETGAVHGDVAVGTAGRAGTPPPSPSGGQPPASTPTPATGGPSAEPAAKPASEPPPPAGKEGEVRSEEPAMTATGPRVGPRPKAEPGDVSQVANGHQYEQLVGLLDARLGQHTPTPPEALAPSGLFGGPTMAAADALPRYDDAIARAGDREVGLWFNMNSGEFQVNIGTKGSVGPPSPAAGWVCLQHNHPGIGEARRFRLPAPADLEGFIRAALRLGTFTSYIESARGDAGDRGRVRVTIDFTKQPAITIEIPTEPGVPGKTLTFANEQEYSDYWGGQTVYAEPGSDLYKELMPPPSSGLPRLPGVTSTGTGGGVGTAPKRTAPKSSVGTPTGHFGTPTQPLALSSPLDRSPTKRLSHGGFAGSATGAGVGTYAGDLPGVGQVAVKVVRVNNAAKLANELDAAKAAAQAGYGPSVYGYVELHDANGKIDPGFVGFAMALQEGTFLDIAGSHSRSPAEQKKLEAERDAVAAGLGPHTLDQLDDFRQRLLAQGYACTGELQIMYDTDGNLRPIDPQGFEPLPADAAGRADAIARHNQNFAYEAKHVRSKMKNPP